MYPNRVCVTFELQEIQVSSKGRAQELPTLNIMLFAKFSLCSVHVKIWTCELDQNYNRIMTATILYNNCDCIVHGYSSYCRKFILPKRMQAIEYMNYGQEGIARSFIKLLATSLGLLVIQRPHPKSSKSQLLALPDYL